METQGSMQTVSYRCCGTLRSILMTEIKKRLWSCTYIVLAGRRDKHEDLSPGVGIAHPLGTCSVHSDTREITALEEDPYILSLLRSNGSWSWVSLLQPGEGQGQPWWLVQARRGLGTAVFSPSKMTFPHSCHQTDLPKALSSLRKVPKAISDAQQAFEINLPS